MKSFACDWSQASESPGVDRWGDELGHQVGQNRPGLDGHHLAKAVDGVVVDALPLL